MCRTTQQAEMTKWKEEEIQPFKNLLLYQCLVFYLLKNLKLLYKTVWEILSDTANLKAGHVL